MLGVIVSIAVGVAAIGLGVRGFSEQGLPVSHQVRIRGTAGKALGIACFLIALAAFGMAALILYGMSLRAG